MTKDKTGPVNRIGMFDTFKGIGMLLVVFGHTFSGGFSGFGNHLMGKLFQLFLVPVGVSLIPAFFMISGYGFRKRPVRKCIRQQAELLLKPYLIVAVATSLCHLLFHYLAFGYWPASVRETLKVAGGFLLALPHNAAINGMDFFGCGAVWYIVALFVGWILLDLIMNTVQVKYVGPAVILVTLTGWLAGCLYMFPFCLSQGMIAVGFLYIGYRAKKNRIFLDGPNRKGACCIFLACAVSAFFSAYSGQTDNMDLGIWTGGPISILMDAVIGVGMVMLILKLDRFENYFLNILQRIGRDSLLIFCIHTVEMIAVPWYLLQEKLDVHPIFCGLLTILLRWSVIIAAIRGIQWGKGILNKRKADRWEKEQTGR